jgi:serine/threonine protein kinase
VQRRPDGLAGTNEFLRMAEPVKTIADFLALVRKSGLVDAATLAERAAAWPDQHAELPAELPEALVAAELLTDWQVEQLCKGKHKGFMLGKYRLLRLLGAGGMSSVYLAENTTLRQRVAIKVLPAKRVSKGSFEDRFGREAKAANMLSHQNIARAFDLDTVGSVQFIVMEYVDGTDLHMLVKEHVKEHGKGLEIREAADYIRQAAVGLHYAHGEQLVHRDIKPANLMLTHKGVIKILDLGLALTGVGDDDDEQASLTRDHEEKVLGTVDYLAPEQARDSHTADARSDIYALGCTLHYLLVGRAPFAQGKLTERIQAHLHKPPPNLLDERPDVPPEIVELYFRMMAKNPDARPQTADDIARALGRWLATHETSTRGNVAPLRRRESPPAGGGPRPAPPPVFRSGPGSGSSSSVSLGPASGRPAADGSGVVRRGPAAATAPRTAVKKPASPKSVPPVVIREGETKPRPRRRRPLEFAGYPLGMWVALVGGLIAVIVLGVLVYRQSTGS